MVLSREDAAQFFRLMWSLQFFVGKQRQLLPDVESVEAYVALQTTAKVKVRDALWAHPGLIDAYVEKNPDGVSPEELNIIRQWKRFIAGKFTVYRSLRAHTIFIGESGVYGVLGLNDPLVAVFAGRPLPIFLETVLLPYRGKIVYDGLCRPYDIYFGAGIRSGLNEEYLAAKQNGRIITSLEPEITPAEPARQHRELDKDSEHALAEIVKTSERVRGGTVIQSAAVGVLRAGAKVAQSAAQQPSDLDGLRRLGRQVQNALNRLETVLDRAER